MPTNPFDSIPEIDFMPRTVDQLLSEMIGDYEREYYRITGTKKSVAPASEERIYLYTEAYRVYLIYQMIDRGLKMNLPKYAEGDFLDNLAALFGIKRLPAQQSESRAQFSLSALQSTSVRIPAGTRLTTSNGLYFATVAETVIESGQASGECNLRSLTAGADTAGINPGQINVLVDPIPFVSEAVNILPSQGGADVESDANLRLRIYYFKDSYSTAGPESAYIYFIRSYSQSIEGISISSTEPGMVNVCITLTGGEIPQQPFIDALQEYLFTDKRPFTDNLVISAPEVLAYAVECTYYIARSNQKRAAEIHKDVEAAVDAYLTWQGAEIGRDISPDMLTKKIMQAGAKRVPIVSPVFTPVGGHYICRHSAVNVAYGGIEND